MRIEYCEWSDLPVYECDHCPAEVRRAAQAAISRTLGTRVVNDTTVVSIGPRAPVLWSGKDAFDAPMPDLPGRTRIKRQSRCRHIPGYGYYLPEHMPECRDHECIGCKPCEPKTPEGIPLTHCASSNCTEHISHANLTCPRCIGRTRDDLQAIETLAALMIHEAIEDGIDSDAADLAGPVADPVHVLWQRVDLLRANHALVELPDDDERHPLSVLGRWELMLREDYDQDYADLPPVTVSGARTWLDSMLNRIAQDRGQDWPLFASEIRTCRVHLEAALHNSQTPEKGAPCPSCPEKPAPPALVKHYVTWDESGAHDFWRCPTCGARWLDAEYRLWVGEDYLEYADKLTANDASALLGIKASQIRVWGAREQIIKAGRNADGMTLYDVASIRARHEREQGVA